MRFHIPIILGAFLLSAKIQVAYSLQHNASSEGNITIAYSPIKTNNSPNTLMNNTGGLLDELEFITDATTAILGALVPLALVENPSSNPSIVNGTNTTNIIGTNITSITSSNSNRLQANITFDTRLLNATKQAVNSSTPKFVEILLEAVGELSKAMYNTNSTAGVINIITASAYNSTNGTTSNSTNISNNSTSFPIAILLQNPSSNDTTPVLMMNINGGNTTNTTNLFQAAEQLTTNGTMNSNGTASTNGTNMTSGSSSGGSVVAMTSSAPSMFNSPFILGASLSALGALLAFF